MRIKCTRHIYVHMHVYNVCTVYIIIIIAQWAHSASIARNDARVNCIRRQIYLALHMTTVPYCVLTTQSATQSVLMPSDGSESVRCFVLHTTSDRQRHLLGHLRRAWAIEAIVLIFQKFCCLDRIGRMQDSVAFLRTPWIDSENSPL